MSYRPIGGRPRIMSALWRHLCLVATTVYNCSDIQRVTKDIKVVLVDRGVFSFVQLSTSLGIRSLHV